ncbi:MAG: hypothetical protein KAS13_00280 [Candidatus Omnitrophica bacterium]|nr:hypothetical protein [Candidatus Omnitrophota bacterium]
MKHVLFYLMVFLMCAAAMPGYSAVVGTTNDEVKNVVEPILDNVMNGFTKDDYFLYSKDFDATLKETITSERFQEIRGDIVKWIGSYLYREYLGFINRDAITIIFWKGVFDKTEDEILIKMVVSERNGEYLITGLWYQ